MEFVKVEEPDLKKPMIIAAMQDMGSVGNVIPAPPDNTMCYIKNTAKSYSFGEKPGATCLTS